MHVRTNCSLYKLQGKATQLNDLLTSPVLFGKQTKRITKTYPLFIFTELTYLNNNH